jgi:hypothetical protein
MDYHQLNSMFFVGIFISENGKKKSQNKCDFYGFSPHFSE